jgi:hypothetical protein
MDARDAVRVHGEQLGRLEFVARHLARVSVSTMDSRNIHPAHAQPHKNLGNSLPKKVGTRLNLQRSINQPPSGSKDRDERLTTTRVGVRIRHKPQDSAT